MSFYMNAFTEGFDAEWGTFSTLNCFVVSMASKKSVYIKLIKAYSWISFHSLQNSTEYSLCSPLFRVPYPPDSLLATLGMDDKIFYLLGMMAASPVQKFLDI